MTTDGSTAGMIFQGAGAAGERRAHVDIRVIFEDAYSVALPFLDPAQGLGGISLQHHVYVVVHETYPDLTNQQLGMLVPALERVFKERSKA